MEKTFTELGIMPMAQAADHLPGTAAPVLNDTAFSGPYSLPVESLAGEGRLRNRVQQGGPFALRSAAGPSPCAWRSFAGVCGLGGPNAYHLLHIGKLHARGIPNKLIFTLCGFEEVTGFFALFRITHQLFTAFLS